MGTTTLIPDTHYTGSRKATHYAQDVENPLDGIEKIEQITDPAEQAREIGRRLGEIPEYQKLLRAMRQKAVLKMKASGKTYTEIGAEIGLHRNRVQQIAEGRTAGGKGGSKTKADAEATS